MRVQLRLRLHDFMAVRNSFTRCSLIDGSLNGGEAGLSGGADAGGVYS